VIVQMTSKCKVCGDDFYKKSHDGLPLCKDCFLGIYGGHDLLVG
jgi:hypothetical protein